MKQVEANFIRGIMRARHLSQKNPKNAKKVVVLPLYKIYAV